MTEKCEMVVKGDESIRFTPSCHVTARLKSTTAVFNRVLFYALIPEWDWVVYGARLELSRRLNAVESFRAVSSVKMEVWSNVSVTASLPTAEKDTELWEHACSRTAYHINPDDGSRDSLRNVGLQSHSHTADRLRRLHWVMYEKLSHSE
jgi:hypothetical protein